jgi:hypothetical protein
VGVLDVPWHNINYAISDLGPDKKGTAPPGRGCNGWDGFTFNRTLFPDPKRFFDRVHSEGVKMILSVHMQNGIDHCQEQFREMATAMGYSSQRIAANWTINCTMDNATYVRAFFDKIVDSAPVKGTADYWWLDYPGGASEISGWHQQEAASLQWSNRMFAEHKRAMVSGAFPVCVRSSSTEIYLCHPRSCGAVEGGNTRVGPAPCDPGALRRPRAAARRPRLQRRHLPELR